MKDLKHTKEPWIISDISPRFVYALRQKGSLGRHGTPNMVNAFSVNVQNDNQIATEEELIANAKLIAAAPELLEALIGILGDTKVLDELVLLGKTREILKAQDAISKATT
jgi:hypothetical protein